MINERYVGISGTFTFVFCSSCHSVKRSEIVSGAMVKERIDKEREAGSSRKTFVQS